MSNLKSQLQVIHDTEALEYITGTLRDISAIELRNLQTSFTKNTSFFEELQKLYLLVWRIAGHTGALLAEDGGQNKKQSLYIAYTTNRHFYGSLNYDVMNLFQRSCGSNDVGIVIGGTGREIWQTSVVKKKNVRFMQFISDKPDENEIKSFLEQVTPYKNSYIVYPRFVSIYEQRAEVIDISFGKSAINIDEGTELPQFVLEPDIQRVQKFFLTQVRHVLFERILLETELSRVATRLVRMDSADTTATDLLMNEKRELRKIEGTFMNARLLENLTGYLQWKHKNI